MSFLDGLCYPYSIPSFPGDYIYSRSGHIYRSHATIMANSRNFPVFVLHRMKDSGLITPHERWKRQQEVHPEMRLSLRMNPQRGLTGVTLDSGSPTVPLLIKMAGQIPWKPRSGCRFSITQHSK